MMAGEQSLEWASWFKAHNTHGKICQRFQSSVVDTEPHGDFRNVLEIGQVPPPGMHPREQAFLVRVAPLGEERNSAQHREGGRRERKMQVNNEHLRALDKFAWGEISLSAMEAVLSEAVGSPMRQNPMMRAFGLNRICPEPRIQITRAHLERVLERKRRKQMSDQDLIDWATMLVINDAYYWNASDAILAEWIGRLHLDVVPDP